MTTNPIPPVVTLLPCPFCGSAPYQHTQNGIHQDSLTGAWWQHVWCLNGECGLIGPEKRTADEAIAAWNTRATPAAVSDVRECDVDALRYLLNWAASNSRVSTIMKTFTVDGETTQFRLERLWKALAPRARWGG